MNTFRPIIKKLVIVGLVWCVFCASNNCQVLSGQDTQSASEPDTKFKLVTRHRSPLGRDAVTTTSVAWAPQQTALVVCDMWDRHHSFNATKRAGELAGRVNRLVAHARKQGVTIIHCPSSCLEAYKNHPARRLAQAAPLAKNLPDRIEDWCDWLSKEEEAAYPIDQSDGGVDDDPTDAKIWREQLIKEGRDPDAPWKTQIDTIKIADTDYLTDSGTENWNIQEHLGIKNVLVLGVHTNMCVLGRPFGLRQMVKNGREVLLVRDLTDAMYNPQMEPNVSHHCGTDLIVGHIEKFICPTITSDQILGDKTIFRFSDDDRKHLVAILAEQEYQTEQTVPEFALKNLSQDFRFSFVHDDPADRDKLLGLEAIKTADVVLISARRRAFPKQQLDLIKAYVASGKPIVAIRTASHAFSLNPKQQAVADQKPSTGKQWPKFDRQILGGNYTGHYGNKKGVTKTHVKLIEGANQHPILTDVEFPNGKAESSVVSWLYKTGPLADGAKVLMNGRIDGDDHVEPVSWTYQSPAGGRVFYTSLGHQDDFSMPFFQRMLRNSVYWAVEMEVPVEEDAESQDNAAKKKRLDQTDSQPPEGVNASDDQSPAFQLRQLQDIPLKVADDLELDLLLEQPQIANPLYLNFDERGRMWVVEYRQYPAPAGLKLISRDNVWRNVYDPPFAPPPPHATDSKFRGADRISIHEDTNGDGQFDSHKIFVDGLNLATAALKGRGGVFVMNPPYLLFYPDTNNDDVPDKAEPDVLLSGFGIEDSHAIANSLRWGPDGWIYATQGSTVSASIVRHGKDGKPIAGEEPIHSMGQNLWRYHPEQRRYEVFAEGGGNAFGVEFDASGNVFSGHNGGNTRGFHYVQGGYYLKNFGKHGSLSNPYAFAHFPAMKHPDAPRFTHTFEIYQATQLPKRYHNRMIALAPHLHQVVLSEISPSGSSFKTSDVADLIVAGKGERADWFTPVDIQTGPDGAVYIADWFSVQSNHYKNHEGQTNPDLGRIYRLRGPNFEPVVPFDLSKVSSEELIDKYLSHSNRWYRETALRILGDRKEEKLLPSLGKMIDDDKPGSLQALWAVQQILGRGEIAGVLGLSSNNADVRRWAVRLIGDGQAETADTKTVQLSVAHSASKESDVAVRSQIASTARKFNSNLALMTVVELLKNPNSSADVHIPNLTWWALEAHADNHQEVLNSIKSNNIWWQHPMRVGKMGLPECLARRWAMQNTNESLQACAQLLRMAPESKKPNLIRGIATAFEGRSMTGLPIELVSELGKSKGFYSRILKIRQLDQEEIEIAVQAIEAAVKSAIRETTEQTQSKLASEIVPTIQVLGEVIQSEVAGQAKVVQRLLACLSATQRTDLLASLLAAVGRSKNSAVAETLLQRLPDWQPETSELAVSILASRLSWSEALMKSLDQNEISLSAFSQDSIERLRMRNSTSLNPLVQKHFPEQTAPTSVAAVDRRIEAVAAIIRSNRGDPLAGKKLFENESVACGKCHLMFGRGGEIGPDLTAFNRADLKSMLLSVLYPSVEIREGYEPLTVLTLDGLLVSGFKVSEDDQSISLRTSTGQTVMIAKDEIEDRASAKKSIMPEGLLDGLTDQQTSDLFAYLASTSPPK